MNYEIKITGSGTAEELAAALRSVADEIAAGDHETSLLQFSKCEWEDPTLMTVIREADDEEEEDDDSRLEEVARLIREGNTSGINPRFTLSTNDVDEGCLKYYGDTDRDHIADKVREGYTSGELVTNDPDTETDYRGHWEISF